MILSVFPQLSVAVQKKIEHTEVFYDPEQAERRGGRQPRKRALMIRLDSEKEWLNTRYKRQTMPPDSRWKNRRFSEMLDMVKFILSRLLI